MLNRWRKATPGTGIILCFYTPNQFQIKQTSVLSVLVSQFEVLLPDDADVDGTIVPEGLLVDTDFLI